MKNPPAAVSRQDSDPSSCQNASAAGTPGFIPEPEAPSSSEQSHSRYQAFLEAIDSPAFVAEGRTGRLLAANAQACRLLGRSLDAILGQHHTMLYPKAKRTHCAALFRQRAMAPLNQTSSFKHLLQIVRADGTTQPCEVADIALEEPTGRVLCAIFRPLRNHPLLEQPLRESETRFTLALRHIDEGIWDWDVASDTVYYAEECLDILGYEPKELPSTAEVWRERLHPDDREWVRTAIRHCAEGRVPAFSVEYRIRHKDGSYRWIRSRGASLRDASGHITRVAGSAKDITDRKQAEQALQESEHRFRLLVENSPDAFFLHDMDGVIIDVNRRACTMLGYTAEELRTSRIETIEVVCPPETLRSIWSEMRPGPFAFDGLGERKDGTTFPTEVQGVAFLERGRMLSLVSVRDVTPRKELEKNLEDARDQALAASRAKTEFLATVSHEIRTPLNILLGMTDLLRETRLTNRQRHHVDSIENAGTLLLRLINDILDLSRIEADRTHLILEDIDPSELLRTTATVVRIPVEQKGLSFTLELDRALPPRLQTDPDRVQQVLMNLIWNAIKFTPQGGITLTATQLTNEPCGPGLHIEVCDTGIGIAPEQQQRIFDPFTQADASSRRRYGGTGLGLAICKRLVTLLGGTLGVRSEPGRGSCFFFTLPTKDEHAKTPPQTDAPNGSPQAGTDALHRVLLVEDSQANQMLVQLFLENEPYDLVVACSGMAALARFAEQSFELVLMDVEMPGMDGLETTAAIRRMEHERELSPTPIVMVTAHAFSAYERQGREVGCNGFLAKPLRKSRLLAELTRHCRTAS